MSVSRTIAKTSPARIIIVSLLATIFIGACLLALPGMHHGTISFFDLLFTTCSATCVTGLLTVPLESFTLWGQTLIALLMQVGGLGVITLTLFLMSLFIDFGYGTQLMAGQLLELESWKNIKKLIGFIISFTMLIELAGAIVVFFIIKPHYSWGKAAFLACFHAISAFCDAGFSLFPQESLMEFARMPSMLLCTMVLMIIGGLGFITWHELYNYLLCWWRKKRCSFSLHSRIVIFMSVIIILLSTLFFFILEYHHSLSHLSWYNGICNAFFNAIAARSTGFYTVPLFRLQQATILLIMVITFIGSSPGSTGSGIKTTTLAILVATIKAALANKAMVSIKGRAIVRDQILKSVAIVVISITWVVVTAFFLCALHPTLALQDVMFETVSAFATLGISSGITPLLSRLGQILIMITMIAGRVGVLTILLTWYKRDENVEFSYPEERIMIG